MIIINEGDDGNVDDDDDINIQILLLVSKTVQISETTTLRKKVKTIAMGRQPPPPGFGQCPKVNVLFR